jgi:hypothetical protein
MANEWDAKLKGFLKKTSEDFKRAGNDIKVEAQRLMKEVKDPEGQEKLKASLKEAGGWAKKTAVELADLAEKGFKQAEGAFRQAGENWKPPATEGTPPAEEAAAEQAPTPTPPSAPPEMEEPEAPAAAPKKTIGKKKTTPSGASKPKASAKKTIGKKQGSS